MGDWAAASDHSFGEMGPSDSPREAGEPNPFGPPSRFPRLVVGLPVRGLACSGGHAEETPLARFPRSDPTANCITGESSSARIPAATGLITVLATVLQRRDGGLLLSWPVAAMAEWQSSVMAEHGRGQVSAVCRFASARAQMATGIRFASARAQMAAGI